MNAHVQKVLLNAGLLIAAYVVQLAITTIQGDTTLVPQVYTPVVLMVLNLLASYIKKEEEATTPTEPVK